MSRTLRRVRTQHSEAQQPSLTLGSLGSGLAMGTATATLLDLVITGGTGTCSRTGPSRGHTLDGHTALLMTTACSASQCPSPGGAGW